MTADERIGKEADLIFKKLSLGEVMESVDQLMVAPKNLQNKIIEKIDREIEVAKNGGEAYLGIKINSLTDKKIIDRLIEASRAGVKIDMVIRGINCLRSGIPEKTDNIRIISIVGRFLEHSRIYIFGKEEREEIFISSADFMTRNTVRRVEVAMPVKDEDIKTRIRNIFNTMLQDNYKARIQKPDGSYPYVAHEAPLINCQEIFYAEAYQAVGSEVKDLDEKENR